MLTERERAIIAEIAARVRERVASRAEAAGAQSVSYDDRTRLTAAIQRSEAIAQDLNNALNRRG